MMQRKTLGYLFALLAVFVPVVWLGCNDEPTSVGLGLLSSQELVRVDTITVTTASGSTVRTYINTGSSGNILLGRSLGYEARALLQFSNIPDTLRSVTVDSAKLILIPSYRFGESHGLLSFTVNKMVQGWTEHGITWDSVTTSSYEATTRGGFGRTVADFDSVVVSLDPNLVMEWFQNVGTNPIQGIILIPTGGSNVIVGFTSFDSTQSPRKPQLLVYYSKGGAQSTIASSSGLDAYVANIDNLASDPNLLYVQAGVAYRSIVKVDFSLIPQHSGIHGATLELTLNRSASRLNTQSVDSLFSFFLASTDSAINASIALGRRLDPNSDVYTFTITPDVQRWINGQANFGLRIQAAAEPTTLDLFTLYSSSASPSLRPRLKIIYSRLL